MNARMMSAHMQIGELARRTNSTAKTIRYYESIGLMPKPTRAENGYRYYGDRDLHRLRFILRARSLGFSVEDVRDLLALYDDQGRASRDVKAMALSQVDRIEAKIKELRTMQRTLLRLAESCHGDERPDCPILVDLAGGGLAEG